MRAPIIVICLTLILGHAVCADAEADDKELGAALKRHRLQLLALDWQPAYRIPEAKTRSRHAGLVKLAVTSSSPLKPEAAQEATEDLRAGVEALGLPHLMGVNVYFYGEHAQDIRSIAGGYVSVPWHPESIPGEGTYRWTLQTVTESGLRLNDAVTWYARGLCWRPYVVEPMKGNALREVRPWQRIDLWAEANEDPPRQGVKVIARPVRVPSTVPVRAALEGTPSSPLIEGTLRPEALSVSRSVTRSPLGGGEAAVGECGVVLHTEGRPLQRKQFEKFAGVVRDLAESWSIPALGAVHVEVHEPGHMPPPNMPMPLRRVPVRFEVDPDFDRGVRLTLRMQGLRVDEPVRWYGTWLWHRALDFAVSRGEELSYRRASKWHALGYWAAGNALPVPDKGEITLHPPRLVKGRLPKYETRRRR